MAASIKDVLKSAFIGAAALTLVAAPVATAPTAFAQSARVEQTSNTVTDYRQARRDAIAKSAGQIVIFYGNGVRTAQAAAMALNRVGYHTIAISDGPDNGAEVFVDRRPLGRIFSEQDMADGTLGANATNIYDQRIGPPNGALALNH